MDSELEIGVDSDVMSGIDGDDTTDGSTRTMPSPASASGQSESATEAGVVSLEIVISEDVKDHHPQCNYVAWNVLHRKALLTKPQILNHLLEFEKRTKGKAKMEKNKESIKQTVESGEWIPKYLEGSRKTYDKFRSVFLEKCMCPQARIMKKTVIGSTVDADTTSSPDGTSKLCATEESENQKAVDQSGIDLNDDLSLSESDNE